MKRVSKKEVLESVKTLLSAPAKWSKNLRAVTKEGNPESPRSPNAVAWSLVGAIYKVGEPRTHELDGAIDTLYSVVQGSIGVFESNASHADLMVVLDRAIAKAGE